MLMIHYDDEALVVVEKPARLPCLPRRNEVKASHPTLADFLPGCTLVHRLDNDTSGLIVAAKTSETLSHLRRQFSDGSVEKEYTALVLGHPPAAGTIDLPIAHHPRKKKKMVVCESEQRAQTLKARPALTHFVTSQCYRDYSLLRVTIATGVRHQIRAHLAAAGFPLAGDRLYQNAKKRAADTLPLARHFLHASRLVLTHPMTGEKVVWVSELPTELKAALDILFRAGDADRSLRGVPAKAGRRKPIGGRTRFT